MPIDFRLFLPKEWTKDQKRCEKAKIPADQAVFKTKHQLALEMVFQARRNGARFQWVGFDGFYGDNPSFLRQLADNGEVFIGDIHKDHTIYYEDPKPAVPTPTSPRGKEPSKLQAQTRSMRADNWVRKQAPGAWQRVAIRESSKGKILGILENPKFQNRRLMCFIYNPGNKGVPPDLVHNAAAKTGNSACSIANY